VPDGEDIVFVVDEPRGWRLGDHGGLFWRAVPVFGLLACAVVLRAPITAVPPLLSEIQLDLGLDPATAGLLTSIPVLCFGLFAPAASQLLGRLGINHAVIYGLAAVVVGSLVRSSGSAIGAFVGTAVIGAGATIGNLGVPMLIGRQYLHRAPLLTGMYTATVNMAVTFSTAFAVPVAARVGWQWSAAVVGVVPGVLGLVVWWVVYPSGILGVRPSLRARAGVTAPVGRVQRSSDRPAVKGRRMSRWPLAWLLAAGFGAHTLAYFAVTAWLPSALVDLRSMTAVQAGFAASLFQACGIAGPLLYPVLVGPLGWSRLRAMQVVCAAWIALPVGMLVAPAGWPVWTAVGGIAQGAFFTALFSVVIERSRNVGENRRLSTFMQSVGYSIAATGPVLTGWLHGQVTGWSAPFALITLALVVMTGCAVAVVRSDPGASASPARADRHHSDL
jgi:CP family cyanate transporter-like MFS transporter